MPDLKPLLCPQSIVVIGASPNPSAIRGRLVRHLLQARYQGKIFPVSRTHDMVQGFKAYRSVHDLPEPADLALVLTPAESIPQVLGECASSGVKSAVIYAAGFAETGTEKQVLQDEIGQIAMRSGMLVCGPNTVGFVNPSARIDATFSIAVDAALLAELPSPSARGAVAAISQSGGISMAIYSRGLERNLPFSYIVNTGNEASLDISDFIDYAVDDPSTGTVLVFVEGFRDVGKFKAAAAKAIEAGKPVIVAKVGRSRAAQRAVASHTAALAGTDAAYDAVFHRYGVIRVTDPEELINMASAFTLNPLPSGRRVGIVTTSGGMAAWTSDVCEAHNLTVPELPPDRVESLREILPAFATPQNPVDVTAQIIQTRNLDSVVETLYDAPNVDAVLVVTSLTQEASFDSHRKRLSHLARRREKPIIVHSYHAPSSEKLRELSAQGLSYCSSLQGSVRALEALANYSEARTAKLWRVGDGLGASAPVAARRILEGAGPVLCEYEAKELLRAYGLPVTEEALVADEDSAVAAAREIGFPVALKLQSPDLPHKTDVAGVVLDLRTEDEVRRAFRDLLARGRAAKPEAEVRGVLVQEMAPAGGRELIVGSVHDKDFGPLLMLGVGGTYVEVLRDVVFAPVPLGPAQARDMIERLEGREILDGVRGEPPADIEALARILIGLSQVSSDFAAEIGEVDLNPVHVFAEGKGAVVVDALISRRTP